MDDLSGMLSQILNDPESMQQIQAVAASLGLGGDNGAQTPAPQAPPALPPPPAQAQPSQGGGLDLSALSSLLGGRGGGQAAPAPAPAPAQSATGGLDMAALSSLLGNLANNAPAAAPAAPTAPAAGGVDLSALSGLVGGLLGNQGGQSPSAGGADLSALTALLSSGQPPQPQSAPGLPFDMNTLLKLQKAMSSVSSNRANVDLLLALKPRLKEQRAKKVDDAIKVMQLIQFLPLIKESGLFGDKDGGGLGSVVGGISDGIGNVLGGLFGGAGGR